MQNEVQIRILIEEDYKSIEELSKQLGYKTDIEDIKLQIAAIINNPDHFAFVAIRNKKIIGYIHCFHAIRLTSKPFTEICGLVVSKDERGKGIGKLLVKHIENTCTGNTKIRVRCNSKRELAHKFYYNLNYTLNKEQKIFEKSMP